MGFPFTAIALNHIVVTGLQYKEPPIDPGLVAIKHVLELQLRSANKMQGAITAAVANSRESRLFAQSLMVGDQGNDIHIRQAAAIGAAETAAIEIRANPAQTPCGLTESPVSTSVTFQGSLLRWCTSI
jgi:hypothetical protein